MIFTAHINVMPLKELLDPQGKAVMSGLGNLGLNQVKDVRIGKHIVLQVEARMQKRQNQLPKSPPKKYSVTR
jgi:phosphoribosylformylglycinamidine synthase